MAITFFGWQTITTLPDYAGLAMSGTMSPIDPKWRSPFIGKSIPEAVAFVRNAPKPPKPLNKRYCAVLTKDELESGSLLICKSQEDETDIESEDNDEDFDEVANEEDDETPSWTAEPGSLKELLLSNRKDNPNDVPTKRRTMKQALSELGNDYEDVQVI